MSQCNTEVEAKDDETSTSTAAPEDATNRHGTIIQIIKRQEISDESKALAQYIRDLYDSGAKLWTKEMFRDIEAELAKEPLPDYVMNRSSKFFLVYRCHYCRSFPI